MTSDDGFGDGLSALQRLGAELVARETERETHEMLRMARAEARRDDARVAIQGLGALMADLWERIAIAAPTTLVFSPQQLQLEGARLDWEVVHDFVDEGSFARSGWDVYAGAHLRLQQRASPTDFPGMSASLWNMRASRSVPPHWVEVTYNAAEGNAPSEEPFALKDLIKADLVAAGGETNLFQAAPPARIDDGDFDAFCDRWMGLVAAAAAGALERPSRREEQQEFLERDQEDATLPGPRNPLMARLKRLEGPS